MPLSARPPTPDAIYDGIVKSLAGDDPEYLSVCVRALKVPAVNIRMEGLDLLSMAIRKNARHCIDTLKRFEFVFDRLSSKENKHPLEEALDANAMVALECLLRAGADPNGPHSRYGTIMHAAAALRLVDSLIPVLCSRHGDPNAISPRDGSTPLHTAVANSQVLNVEQLLERGANVNAVDNLGRTPIHLSMSAAASDQLVAILLNFGADPLIADGGELTAIDLAEVRQEPALVKLLKERSSWDAQLVPVLKLGKNRPLKAEDFRYELLQAVNKGNQHAIRELLDVRGGELWKPLTVATDSPLLTALAKKRLDLAALLISRRVGIFDRDAEQRNMAHFLLAATNRPDAIQAFLNAIAQISPAYLTEKDAAGYPPLESSIAAGMEHHIEAVQSLIESLSAGATPAA